MRGMFLNGTCCLIPFLLPFFAIVFVIELAIYGMLVLGILLIIIGIIMSIYLNIKKKQMGLTAESENQDINENYIVKDMTQLENNEIKKYKILNIVRIILFVFGIVNILPTLAIWLFSVVNRVN